jgi:hypothetical protein
VNWLAHVLGLDNGSGMPYLAWSGPGADLGELAIVGGMVNMARRHNCHVKGCWRVGRHPVAGTAWTVCARHHPEGAPSATDVRGML